VLCSCRDNHGLSVLGLKRIRERPFVAEDLADPVTVALVTSKQHQVSLKKVIDWKNITHANRMAITSRQITSRQITLRQLGDDEWFTAPSRCVEAFGDRLVERLLPDGAFFFRTKRLET
jgi:hypothetical protein